MEDNLTINAQGFLHLGKVDQKQKRWKKAFGAFKKASMLDPDLIEPRVYMAKLYLVQASGLKSRGNEVDAANALGLVQDQIKEIRARDPDNNDALTLEATPTA